jgi:O-antigen/teichoic acid export membrane protein
MGIYLINNQLRISPDKISVAMYILHFVVASTFISVISVPFDAVIIANENFLFLAIVNILNSLFKLAIAFSIFLFSSDRLIYYGLLTMISAIIIRIIKGIYTKKKYKECNVDILNAYDYNEIKGIGRFAGWSLFGSLCSLARNQGVAVVLNLFYSTVVNAAYGVAHQVNSQIMFFSQTMMNAMRPQIMKSEGANNRERMIRLALTANKFSFYLFTFFAVPLFFEMPFVLKLWLKNVPEYTVEFCRSIILLTMMNQINMGLMTAVQAIGRIKIYQIVAGGIQLLTLPIGFIFLKLGYPPYSIILVSFILETISTIFRVFYFKYLTGYSVYEYFKNVLLNSFLSIIPVILVVYYVQNQFSNNWLNLILVFVCSMLTYLISIYFIGLGMNDKYMLKQLFKTIKNKILKQS